MNIFVLLLGVGIACCMIGVGGVLYFSTIPSDVIFVNEKTDEILSNEEMFDKVFPLLGTIIVMSIMAICLILLRIYYFSDEERQNYSSVQEDLN